MKNHDIYLYARFCGYLAFIGSAIFTFIVITSVLIPNLNQQATPTIDPVLDWFLIFTLVETVIIILWSMGLLLFTLGTTTKQSDSQQRRIAPHQTYTPKRVTYLWIQSGLWLFRISIIITIILFITVFFRFVDIRTGYPYYCDMCQYDPIYDGGVVLLTFMGVMLVFGICLEHIFRMSYRLLLNSHKNYTYIITKYPQYQTRMKRNWLIILFNGVLWLCTLGIAGLYISWFIATPRIMLSDLATLASLITGWFCIMAIGYTLYLNQRSLTITRAIKHQLSTITNTTSPIQAPSFRRLQGLAFALILGMSLLIIGFHLLSLWLQIFFAFEYDTRVDANVSVVSTLMMAVPFGIVLLAFGELILITRHLARETHINQQLMEN